MKKNKKLLLIPSFAIAAALVAGPVGIISASGDYSGMMNGMMNGEGMNQMMEAMNSPEGKEMINACQNFMTSEGMTEETE